MADSASMVDGFQSMIGGMHAGLDPEVVPEGSYSLGINVMSRGGLIRTRPGFTRGPSLPAGVFLGMGSWTLNGSSRIVLVLSGQIVVVDVNTDAVTPLGPALSASALCNFVQADRYLVIMNGVDRPVILEDLSGVPSVKATPASFPTGPLGSYVFGRIHMTPNYVPNTTPPENGRPYFVSGDVIEPLDPSTCLNFIETEYWSEGGAHGLPLEMGYISAFAPIRNASTGTGYGQLLVFAQRGVSAFDVSVARTEWKETGISQVLFFGPGAVSPWATIPVNSTVFYRAVDGLRIISYATSAAQSNEILGNVPQSSEVGPYMDGEDHAYFPRISAATASNRVFITAGGVDDVWFKGLVVLDSARAYTRASPQAETAYDGVWQITDRKIGGVVVARRSLQDTLFAYCDDGYLWYFDESSTSDYGLPIQARLVTRALTISSGPDRKRLKLADVWLRGLTSSGSVTLRYRPTEFPYWALAGTQNILIGAGSLAQKRHLSWGFPASPSIPCDAGESSPLTLATSFQFAIDWTGPMVVPLMRIEVESKPEAPSAPCGDTVAKTVSVPTGAEELGVWL